MNGLFADHGMDVEILEPSGGPDNVVRVGSGESDFALTSVQHYLSARAAHGDIAARFVAMVVERSPIGALVPAASPLQRPADLAGRRVGGDPTSHQVIDFMASLDHLGVVPTGSMDADRWQTTLEFLCHSCGLPVPEPETVYRPQFLGAAAYA